MTITTEQIEKALKELKLSEFESADYSVGLQAGWSLGLSDDAYNTVVSSLQQSLANTWRDIGTAPRDGKPFIGWWPDQYHFPVVIFWADKWNPFIGWKVMGWTHEKFMTEPTHWKPLDKPPQIEEIGGVK